MSTKCPNIGPTTLNLYDYVRMLFFKFTNFKPGSHKFSNCLWGSASVPRRVAVNDGNVGGQRCFGIGRDIKHFVCGAGPPCMADPGDTDVISSRHVATAAAAARSTVLRL